MSDRRVISRGEAIAAGQKTYFTGKPCRRGHVSERYVCSYVCIDCGDLNGKAWSASNPEKVLAMRRRWSSANRDRHREMSASWRRRNPEKERAKASRPEYIARRKAWKAANKGKVLAYIKKRRLALKNRVPQWADLKAIERIYEFRDWMSRMTGIEHHVDHELPLFGKTVSGLHVASNLRVIPAKENLRKNRSVAL